MDELKELCIGLSEAAKKILQEDKEVFPIVFLVTSRGVEPIPLNDYDKDNWNDVIKIATKKFRANSGALVCEAWVANDTSTVPSKNPNRKEIILVQGFAPGRQMSFITEFERFGDKFAFDETRVLNPGNDPEFKMECRFTKGIGK